MAYESTEFFAEYAEVMKAYHDESPIEEDEAKKTHGPSGHDWGPKTERCITKWHQDEPGTDKSKIVAICRWMHKDN